MVQGTIQITKNLTQPCWTFMTVCTLTDFLWTYDVTNGILLTLTWIPIGKDLDFQRTN